LQVIAKFKIKQGLSNEEIEKALGHIKVLVEATRKEEGCVEYTCYRDPDQPINFVVVELWKSEEALKLHFTMEHMKNFKELRGNFGDGDVEVLISNVHKVQ